MKKNTQAEFVKWFGPLLDALRALGNSGKPKEVFTKIAEKLNLPDEILDSTLKSGGNRFHNQVAWARQYLVWEELLDSSKHGTWKLTQKGKDRKLTEEQGGEIFQKWVRIHQNIKKAKNDENIIKDQEEKTPEEYEKTAPCDLLEVLQSLSPSGFEKICKELLRESGFENVEVTGRPHDEGIDGYAHWKSTLL